MTLTNLLKGKNWISRGRRNGTSGGQSATRFSSFAPRIESLDGRLALSARPIVSIDDLQAGDANGDSKFDQMDIIQVLQEDRYMTGESAGWSEGDWNQDGVFNQLDIVAALQDDNYLQDPQAGDVNGDSRFDQTDIVQVLQEGKYMSGDAATHDQGDWNGDGVFDNLDFVAALQAGNYLS